MTEIEALKARLRTPGIGVMWGPSPFEEAADAIEHLEAENAKLRDALEQIAKQQQAHEMSAYARENADFDEAYDLIIYEARAALAGDSHDQ